MATITRSAVGDGYDLASTFEQVIAACEACAEECAPHDTDACRRCVETCRQCADDCREVLASL